MVKNCPTLNRIKEENNQLKETATGAEKGLEKLAEETSECGMWLEKAENEIVLQKEQIGALEKERDTLKKSISDAEQNNYKGFAVLENELKKYVYCDCFQTSADVKT